MRMYAAYADTWDLPTHDAPTVPPLRLGGRSNWWGESWLTLPPTVIAPAVGVASFLDDLAAWTGWSNRDLATALGTSHPTVGALRSGEAVAFARRPEIRHRLADLHALCTRLRPMVYGDATRLGRLLTTAVAGQTPLELVRAGAAARAYLFALRTLAPEPEEEFPSSVFPARAGRATTALHD